MKMMRTTVSLPLPPGGALPKSFSNPSRRQNRVYSCPFVLIRGFLAPSAAKISTVPSHLLPITIFTFVSTCIHDFHAKNFPPGLGISKKTFGSVDTSTVLQKHISLQKNTFTSCVAPEGSSPRTEIFGQNFITKGPSLLRVYTFFTYSARTFTVPQKHVILQKNTFTSCVAPEGSSPRTEIFSQNFITKGPSLLRVYTFFIYSARTFIVPLSNERQLPPSVPFYFLIRFGNFLPMSREYVLQPFQKPVELKIDYARELNEQQHAAVTALPGPALVIAGAGSGKTRTLTYRVAYLLEQGIQPERILLLTFTNKAAREMMRRVNDILGQDLTSLWGGTFHSIGNRILRKHAPQLGLRPDFTILDREDTKDLIKAAIDDAKIDVTKTRFPKPEVVGDIISMSLNISK